MSSDWQRFCQHRRSPLFDSWRVHLRRNGFYGDGWNGGVATLTSADGNTIVFDGLDENVITILSQEHLPSGRWLPPKHPVEKLVLSASLVNQWICTSSTTTMWKSRVGVIDNTSTSALRVVMANSTSTSLVKRLLRDVRTKQPATTIRWPT